MLWALRTPHGVVWESRRTPCRAGVARATVFRGGCGLCVSCAWTLRVSWNRDGGLLFINYNSVRFLTIVNRMVKGLYCCIAIKYLATKKTSFSVNIFPTWLESVRISNKSE